MRHSANCLGLGVGLFISLIYAKFMLDLHENTLWFSNIKEVEREISFRTESGLYFSYYKQFVNTESLPSAFYSLIHDNITEYPFEINVLQRFNVIPEVYIGVLYRLVASSISVSPIFFYIYCSFLFSGLAVFAVYFLAYLIIGSWCEASIVSIWMLVNYEDSSRVNFAVNMREVYALPFLWVQFFYVFKVVTFEKSCNKQIALFTFLFSICWQFNQFVLILQSFCLFITSLFYCDLRALICQALVYQSIGYLVAGILQFFQPMLLLSPLLQLNLIIFCCMGKAPNQFRIVRSSCLVLFVFFITIFANCLIKVLIGDKSDSHIWSFVMSKLGFGTDQVSFETALYLCHSAFAFLGYDFVERTSKNGSFQLFLISLVVSCINIIREWWDGRLTKPHHFLLTLKCLVFGFLAFTTMRMKYIFLPLMLILASTAFRVPQRLVGRIIPVTLMLALAIGILSSHYSFYQKVMSHEQEFYDPDTVKLMEWIEQQPEKMVFSGSMQLLAGVKCCTGRPITNHPHFEDSRIRERTFRIYQIYGRRSVVEVYQILKQENTTHIIVEDSICSARSNGCALKDLVDTSNGHRTESGRYPFVSKKELELSPVPRFCDMLRKKGHSLFVPVFRNRTFRVYRLS